MSKVNDITNILEDKVWFYYRISGYSGDSLEVTLIESPDTNTGLGRAGPVYKLVPVNEGLIDVDRVGT